MVAPFSKGDPFFVVGGIVASASRSFAMSEAALGRPIATLPLIQRRIGEGEMALRAARSVLYDTARAWAERPDQRDRLGDAVAAAKYLCTNAAATATDAALRVAGGFGLLHRLPLERLFRDARAGLTHPPQDDAALEIVGRAALAANQLAQGIAGPEATR